MGKNKKRHTSKIVIKPQSKEKSASAGSYGPKARTQAIFTFLGALAKGGGTIRRRRRPGLFNRGQGRRPEPEALLYR